MATATKQKYKDLDDYSLGSWVTNQRALYNKGKLKPEYKRQLDEIGFIWNIEEASWQENLRSFKSLQGTRRPLPTLTTFKLFKSFMTVL